MSRKIQISLPSTGDEEWQATREPLTTGWFAIRTVRSHLVVKNLKIGRPSP